MFAICSTRKGHVKKHVDQLRNDGNQFVVFQFRADEHDRLSKVRDDYQEIISSCNKAVCDHVIDIDKGILHKKNCADTAKVVNATVAHILNPASTGLKLCRCMRKK